MKRPTVLALVLLSCCTSDKTSEVQLFLDDYNRQYAELIKKSIEAAWKTNTEIREGDTLNAWESRVAEEALTAFTGSVDKIEKSKKWLAEAKELDPLQVAQLEAILFSAGSDPQTVAPVVKERIRLAIDQTEKLFGFAYAINGKPVSTNDIERILREETRLPVRLAAWEASKEVGKVLKPGVTELRKLRNETVQALGYADFFAYQVSEYGMSTDEMMTMMRRLNEELRPLYRELHTYARYELSKKYGVTEVPDMIPAHWLPNRWAQDWGAMVDVEGLDLDGVLAAKSPEWIVREGENFYVSLGFDKLPETFWAKSNLYPYPADSAVKKNNHGSAWHIDLDKDVRSLMSVEPNAEWYETSNHELGHIYYFLSYSRPQIPPVLRKGANRAFHEAIGSMMGMAAMQKPYLINRGLIPPDTRTDSIRLLLKEALQHVVFIPFGAGVMTEFEKELYADDLPQDQFNERWWELVRRYQGVVPPGERGEEYCDAATKTHITDDAAQYYDYALSTVLMFQLHRHIAINILDESPSSTNYFGSRRIGDFLKKIMEPGASQDWRKVISEATGEDMKATAMLDYFEPLMVWLKEQNKGRKHTLE